MRAPRHHERPIGTHIHHLTIVSRRIDAGRVPRYRWRCDCDNEVNAEWQAVVTGRTKRCRECADLIRGIGRRTHYQSHSTDPVISALYRRWHLMKSRCYNRHNVHYAAYGGRGIRVCAEWLHDFAAYRDWALANGFHPNLWIDRKDNNGNYEPSNCQWITPIEQVDNRQRTRQLTAWGETKLIIDWARDDRCAVTYAGLCERYQRPDQWTTPEEMIATPAYQGILAPRAGTKVTNTSTSTAPFDQPASH